MIVQYQNSIDDYKEMTDAIAAARRPVNGAGQIPILVVVFGVYYGITRYLWQKAGDVSGHMAWVNIWIAIVAFGVTWLGMTLPASFRARRFPWLTGRQFVSVGTFIVLIASLVFQHVWNRKYSPTHRSDTLTWQILLPHSIWLLLLFYVSAVAAYNYRTSLVRRWGKRPDLHRHQTADISANGVTFADTVSRREMAWAAFVKGEETRNLFLLFTWEQSCYILPKREFASEEELDAMRNLMNFIPKDQGRGFVVTQVSGANTPNVLPAHAA